MPWSRWLPLSLVVLLGLPSVAHARVWEKDFRTAGRPTVRIVVGDARVNVRATTTGPGVRARVERTGEYRGLVLSRPTPQVRLEQHGDVVEIEARHRGGAIMIAGVGTVAFAVDVDVPAGCDLDIRADDGPLTITGVHGKVRSSSSDGHVTLRGVHGDIGLVMDDGRLTAEALDGSFELSSDDGPASVSGRFDALQIEHADGRLDVEVLPGSKLAAAWSIETDDGRLALALPRDLAATLDARSDDGRLRVVLPTQEIEADSEDRSMRVELNGGGPMLRVRTNDGGITISTAGRASAGIATTK